MVRRNAGLANRRCWATFRPWPVGRTVQSPGEPAHDGLPVTTGLPAGAPAVQRAAVTCEEGLKTVLMSMLEYAGSPVYPHGVRSIKF